MRDKINAIKEKIAGKLPALPKITVPEKFAKYTKHIKYGVIGLVCVFVVGVGAFVTLSIVRNRDAETYGKEEERVAIADRFLAAQFIDLAALYDDYFVEEYTPAEEAELPPPPPPPLSVRVNDVPVVFNSRAMIFRDVLYVPLRGVFEALGYWVNWDSGATLLMVSNGRRTFVFTEENIRLTTDGDILIPLAFAMERMGYDYYFDDETNIFAITYIDNAGTEYTLNGYPEEYGEYGGGYE